MSIIIKTYSNPYYLNKEKFWGYIKNAFQLCVSQTLVNGMCDNYSKYFYLGKLTTISSFVNNYLFRDWYDEGTIVKQYAEIDNLILNSSFNGMINDDIDGQKIRDSLRLNRQQIFNSIRIMFELDMDPDEMLDKRMSEDQRLIKQLYIELRNQKHTAFTLKKDFTEEEVNTCVFESIKKKLCGDQEITEDAKQRIQKIDKDIIVIHGIHQFSPLMLRAIEILSQTKTVVMLFNYQPDYANVYQTWLNIYDWFESEISISDEVYRVDSNNEPASDLAKQMGKLINGDGRSMHALEKQYTITSFDSMTEYAGYIARKFEEAVDKQKLDNEKHPSPLYYMTEQFYVANNEVNDILKVYFPEQFGERQFLDYPLGHFFISVMNMWDPDTGEARVNDLDDIAECLSSGIIIEKEKGALLSAFNSVRLVLMNESTIAEMIKKLKKLIKRKKKLQDEEYTKRIEYFQIDSEKIDSLIEGLDSLDIICKEFFEDFNASRNNFKAFYDKVKDLLVTRVMESDECDAEFKNIIERLLLRLNESNLVDANASFGCLKDTMQIYLQQKPNQARGANWIARNFEQIDGDIIRTSNEKVNRINHFGCLSDEDITSARSEEFPWPLNIQFFEYAQAPVDWKYHVYVHSMREFKNFKRYALLYGLQFSKADVELSYVKHDNKEENELYHIFRILNLEVKKNSDKGELSKFHKIRFSLKEQEMRHYGTFDLYKYRMCPYRFLLESVVQGDTVYSDDFLLKQYLRILLENRYRENHQNQQYFEASAIQEIGDDFDTLRRQFSFTDSLDQMDIVRDVNDYLRKNVVNSHTGRIPAINESDREYMKKREVFIVAQMGENKEFSKKVFEPATQHDVDTLLSMERFENEYFDANRNAYCKTCGAKNICLEIFRYKPRNKGE